MSSTISTDKLNNKCDELDEFNDEFDELKL